MTTEPLVTPPPAAAESPFATTRLPDLPPTTRLQVQARGWAAWWRLAWPALLVGAGLALALAGLAWAFSPAAAQPRALLMTAAPATVAPTPSLAAPITVAARAAQVAPPAPAPRVVAYWGPGGEAYGEVELAGAVDIVEQYRGWARFRTPHLAQDLWAPREALLGIGLDERLALAPEIAPTALPATATPAPIYVAAPPADLVAIPPTAPVISEAGNIVLEDTAERYVVVRPTAAGAPPAPTAGWGQNGGGGGGWDD